MKKIVLTILFINLIANFSFCDSRSWQERKSSHFEVYFSDAPPDFIEKIIEEAEDYYKEITYDLGFTRQDFWLWDDRAKIYIYKDAEDYHKSTGQPEWTSGVTSYQDKTISTYPLAAGFFDTLLPHELGHIIFREFVGYKVNLPIWLDEGVAAYQEKARRWGSNSIVKKAIDNNTFIPLDKLSGMSPHSIQDKAVIELIYAESASVVYFLIVKQGKTSFVELCRRFKEGKTLDEAIKSVYVRYENVKDLNDAWVRHIKYE